MWTQYKPDLVLLDLTLPQTDGLTILQTARAAGMQTPVIILTARGTVGDKILGLNNGADDYLPKPFDLDELEARVRALLRRGASSPTGAYPASPAVSHAQEGISAQIFSLGHLQFDNTNQAAYWQGEILELPPRELTMLGALMHYPNKAVAKERLFKLIFPSEKDVQFEAIDVVAYRLRKKLAHTHVSLITLRGLGYLLKLTG